MASSLINTGTNQKYKVKNIYDMAGNLYEWTMENYDEYQVYRGGFYDPSGSNRPVSHPEFTIPSTNKKLHRFPYSFVFGNLMTKTINTLMRKQVKTCFFSYPIVE